MRKMKGRTKSPALFLTALAMALLCLWSFEYVGWSANYPTTSVQPTQIVPVDVEPGLCPNPLKVSNGGEVSVAILGTETLDVTQIVPESVRLQEIPPKASSFTDVATPYRLHAWYAKGKKVREGRCTDKGPDGKLDLVLQVDKKDLMRAWGKVQVGDVLVVRLRARHKSGVSLVGQDVVIISK